MSAITPAQGIAFLESLPPGTEIDMLNGSACLGARLISAVLGEPVRVGCEWGHTLLQGGRHTLQGRIEAFTTPDWLAQVIAVCIDGHPCRHLYDVDDLCTLINHVAPPRPATFLTATLLPEPLAAQPVR